MARSAPFNPLMSAPARSRARSQVPACCIESEVSMAMTCSVAPAAPGFTTLRHSGPAKASASSTSSKTRNASSSQ